MQNVVLNCDCLEYMQTITDKYFDLAIVDPPYGIKMGGTGGASVLATKKNYKPYYGKDEATPGQEYFDELFRISKNQIIFGGNYMVSKIKKDSACWIVWDKDNGANDFADCELAWTSFKTSIRQFTFRWQGMLQGDMKHKEPRIHPNQKPVDLYKWILRNYAKPGDKVFDSHVGSGSSRIACHDMGFDFIGCEIDKDYFEAQEKRFSEHCAQKELFVFSGGEIQEEWESK